MPEDGPENIFSTYSPKKRSPQTFRVGERVRVCSGPFAAFTGVIEGINQAKRLLKVRVEIMGRETPVKLNFADVEKLPSI